MILKLIKCLKCPYNLGFIKCIVSPCPECLLSKRKKHPFMVPEKNIKMRGIKWNSIEI